MDFWLGISLIGGAVVIILVCAALDARDHRRRERSPR